MAKPGVPSTEGAPGAAAADTHESWSDWYTSGKQESEVSKAPQDPACRSYEPNRQFAKCCAHVPGMRGPVVGGHTVKKDAKFGSSARNWFGDSACHEFENPVDKFMTDVATCTLNGNYPQDEEGNVRQVDIEPEETASQKNGSPIDKRTS